MSRHFGMGYWGRKGMWLSLGYIFQDLQNHLRSLPTLPSSMKSHCKLLFCMSISLYILLGFESLIRFLTDESLSVAMGHYLPLCTEEGGLVQGSSRYKVPLRLDLPVQGLVLLIFEGIQVTYLTKTDNFH